MAYSDSVLDLVACYQDLCRRGQQPNLETLCADRPDLLPEVQEALRILRPLDRLLELDTQRTPPQPTVPGYEILRELGRGGMGVVFLARQLKLERLVALKMVPRRAFPDPGLARRLHAEALTLAEVKHPHVVQIHDVVQRHDEMYLALEYMEGGSLGQHWNRTPQPPREAAKLLETLARTIHAVHDRDIIHRDLKPQNILLTADGLPKITDFGLAKRLDHANILTSPGAILGTPTYMSPEQAAGTPECLGPATDVYALGAILYEALTGRPPFMGDTVLNTLEQVRTKEPVAPTTLQPKVPRDLETICLKCLEKEPARRYAGAAALADDLQLFLKGEPIRGRPVGPVEKLWRLCRRNPWTASLAAGMLVALVGTTVASVIALVASENSRKVAEDARKDIESALRAEEIARGRAEDALVFSEGILSDPDSYALLPGFSGLTNVMSMFVADPEAFRQTLLENMLHKAATKLTAATEQDELTLARLRHALGDAYLRADFRTHAMRCFEQALAIRRARLGVANSDTLATAEMLAQTTVPENPFKAGVLWLDIIKRRQETLGADHPDTLRAVLISQMNDRSPFAVPRIEDTRTRAMRTLGGKHPITLGASFWLAVKYEDANRFADARTVLAETIPLSENSLGKTHPFTLLLLQLQAMVVHRATQRFDLSLPLLEDNYARYYQRYGMNHAESQRSMLMLAKHYHNAKRYAEAERLYREYVRLKRDKHLPKALELADSMKDLGLGLLHGGRHAEAERQFQNVIALRQSLTPITDWQTLDARHLLGVALREQQRFEESEKQLLEAHDGLTAASSNENKGVLIWTKRQLVTLYERWGKPDQVEHWKDKLGEPMK